MDVAALLSAVSRLKRSQPRNEDVLIIDREVVALLASKTEPKKERVDRRTYMREYMRDYRRREPKQIPEA